MKKNLPQAKTTKWFKSLRTQIMREIEAIEDEYAGIHGGMPARFIKTPWSRMGISGQPGGGEMGLMRDGLVFEKAGVNISTVWGEFSKEMRDKIPGAVENDGQFWAAGISLVMHPRNPFVPPVHMNTRHIITSKSWFGGGADLNPIYKNDDDTKLFHDALKQCCDKHGSDYYDKYSKWAETYFWNAHRNEPRGVGGIFYDYLESNWDKDFEFTKDVGTTFLDIYPKIVRAHMFDAYKKEHEDFMLFRRGRYAEFNLIHDRGTVFGLKTGGNPDAILMSLPPRVHW